MDPIARINGRDIEQIESECDALKARIAELEAAARLVAGSIAGDHPALVVLRRALAPAAPVAPGRCDCEAVGEPCPECGHDAEHHSRGMSGWICVAPFCYCKRKHTATTSGGTGADGRGT